MLSEESLGLDKSQWLNDKQLGLALLAAPVVWLALYVLDARGISLAWMLDAPSLFFMLVIVRPVLEEIVFRGLLQGCLLKHRCFFSMFTPVQWGISYANILVSVFFTALHLFSHVWWVALTVLIPSLIFGYFRDRYDGFLLPSIALHCFYNAGYFILYPPLY
ncbi:MAG: JDVT-CTERM system glutamic-type intramembrane protease [Mariprofundaceae bacterium]|nr:JDVT-CTERM system glutamic-type intramembrane protease [Mariprofundaceae bacterium]